MGKTAVNEGGGGVRSGSPRLGTAAARPERRQPRGQLEGRDSLVATAAYQPEPTAAAAARRFVRDTLQSWLVSDAAADGHGLVDDAVLLTSELVTNAVVHAGTAVEVTCRLADGGVEVVVSDGHPARLVPEPPENEHIPAERTSGRGLLLPAALASAWGVSYGQAAKSVWFRIGPAGTAAAGGHEGGAGATAGPGFTPATAGLDGPAALAAALRQAPVTAEADGAAAGRGSVRWPAPPFGQPAYDELLAAAVEAAREAVDADAAYVLVPDEDGDLRLRAATGSFPAAGGQSRLARRTGRPAGPARPAAAARPAGQGPGPDPATRAGQGPGPDPAARAGRDQPPGETAGQNETAAGREAAGGHAAAAGRETGTSTEVRVGGQVGEEHRAGASDHPGASGPVGASGPAGVSDRAGVSGPAGVSDPAGRMHGPGMGSLAAMRAAAGAAPSVLTVPFVVDGRVTGLLAVASATPDRFRDDEAVRLQQLADRWGPPLERARLSELERVRRGRIGALAQARELLTAGADRDEVLALAGKAAVPRLAPWCAVLLPGDGTVLRTAYARHMEEDLSAPLAWLLDRVAEAAGVAQLTPRPARAIRSAVLARWLLAVPGAEQAPRRADALAADAAWCFPLGADASAGLLAVGHRRDERLPREVAELAADLASRIGVALDHARLVGQQH
jgi:anti-sigma regulatory factor (Ser/Thr protein kinase)/GAF domain-containing protein